MDSFDPLIGKFLGIYRIERLLGQGGMARVYYAWDTRLDRPVAVKVMDDRLRQDQAYRNRFLLEARAVAAWRHPNILQIYTAGEERGIPYFTMEYIRGMDLGQLLHRYQQAGELMPYDDVLVIGRAVASALDYAHHKGLIHRDLKPSNVLISEDDQVVLSDFGLAMIVSDGTMGNVFGSPQYMSPEQARNSAQAVPQSDLYSLGVMLFEILTGELPFHDPSPTALALKHIAESPPSPRLLNPRLGQAVEEVLLAALRKTPQERFRTGRELLNALEKALTGAASPAPMTQPAHPSLIKTPASLTQQTLTYVSLADRVIHPPRGGSQPPPSMPGRPGVAAPGSGAGARSLPHQAARLSIGCLAFFLLGALVLVMSAAFILSKGPRLAGVGPLGRNLTSTPTRATTRTTTPTPFPEPATLTASATETSTPTATLEPTATPSMTPTATRATPTQPSTVVYELLILTSGDDSIFLINEGPDDFRLEPLELVGEKGHIPGKEWEVERLKAGECVAAWKKVGKPDAPGNTDCKLVGKRVIRDGSARFWKDTFKIYYQDELVGECRPGKEGCTILIEK